MGIDRSVWVWVIAAACSAGACEVYVGEPPKTAQNVAPPAQPAPPPTANQSTPSSPPPPQGPVKTVVLHMGHGGGGAAAPAPGPSPAAPSAPAACLDTGPATLSDCAAMQAPDPTCATTSVARQRCDAYRTYFDPKVAAAAVSCMTALTSKQVCDASQASGCAKAALAQACPDPTLAQLCQVAAASCRANPSDCTALLSGLNDQGKQAVAQCVAQGCQNGLFACVDGLTTAAPPAVKSAFH